MIQAPREWLLKVLPEYPSTEYLDTSSLAPYGLTEYKIVLRGRQMENPVSNER